MDPTPFFIIGALFGATALLLIQWYGRRRARAAVAEHTAAAVVETRSDEQATLIAHLFDRVAVLERIATDAPNRVAGEIEKLR